MSSQSSALFSPLQLGDLTLDNRIVVSPMCQYAATDGVAEDWHLMNLGQYAMGAAGLVFAEATAVTPQGRISPKCLSLHNDACENGLKRVVDFCKQYGVSKIGIQLAHAGRKASTHPPSGGGKPLQDDEGAWPTIAPSALPYDSDWHVPHALSLDDIAELRQHFLDAATRSLRIGFDVIELHGGHGYLLHQFMSPISNRRDDQYGGSLENRIRLPLEIMADLRALVPSGYPLGIRISATDWVDGGWTPDETVVLCQRMKEIGCDYVDITSGALDPRQKIPLGPGYQVPFAEQVKREAEITTMTVGMIRDPHLAEKIVSGGQADLIALARGMMYDPRWAWHAAITLGAETPYAPQYARANPRAWPLAFPELD
jgi:2,4-dienoyl-CoA reductase-like NADH-dependent reductase (Old Yellow Enzyme family)